VALFFGFLLFLIGISFGFFFRSFFSHKEKTENPSWDFSEKQLRTIYQEQQYLTFFVRKDPQWKTLWTSRGFESPEILFHYLGEKMKEEAVFLIHLHSLVYKNDSHI